jgi:hypothetical protein
VEAPPFGYDGPRPHDDLDLLSLGTLFRSGGIETAFAEASVCGPIHQNLSGRCAGGFDYRMGSSGGQMVFPGFRERSGKNLSLCSAGGDRGK